MMKYALLAGVMMIAAPAFAQDESQVQTGRAPIAADGTTTAPTQPQAAPQQLPAAPVAQPAAPAATAQAAPVTTPATDPAPESAQAQPAAATPAAPATEQAATAPAQPTPAQPTTQQAAATPASGGEQVAAVVGKEFPSYDANKDGNLSQAEFASWMVALKKASDPATVADSAETKSWIGAAFAQADKDKSKSVSQSELTGFLSQGQS